MSELRIAVLTGAGRGIGRALAVELARAGYGVALQSRTEADLGATGAAVEAAGGRAILVPGDVTERSSAERLVERAEAELGPVTVAVACAGQALSAPFLKTSASDLKRLLEVNVLSAFHLLQVAGASMVAGGRPGRLVAVGSTASVRGAKYTAAYSASKHALLGMVRSAALELAPKGITVNVLCPGWVDTPMFEQTLKNIASKTGRSEAEARRSIEGTIPSGVVLRPEDVAAGLRYLVSDAAAQLTGQALVIDGGTSL